MKTASGLFLLFLLLFSRPSSAANAPLPVRVGSKVFTESVILCDAAGQLAQGAGAKVEYRRQLGGTRVLWDALRAGQIDIYPEYTGTISEEILAGQNVRSEAELRAALAPLGIVMGRPLGFNNTYAIGMNEAAAERLGIRTLTGLREHPELRFGFSNEFLKRGDGWPSLRTAYRLAQQDVRGLDHDLAYRALQAGTIDATDLYSTDAEIQYYHLRVLKDDLHHFPDYSAVFLYRADLVQRWPAVVKALQQVAGRISEGTMARLNARVKLEHEPDDRVAADYLKTIGAVGAAVDIRPDSMASDILARTVEHLSLVSVSLLAAILAGIPLGIAAAKYPHAGQFILGTVAALYTIPSLALLVFLIPLLGIGAAPAITALFLYSLLPIVRNTHAGLVGIPLALRESAEAMGLPPAARLRRVELPSAMAAILAGIKTSAVINVGTATLGALIGAGGYGQPILTGIRLDSTRLILEGAIPAAVMALLVQGIFEWAERAFIPRPRPLNLPTPPAPGEPR